MQNLSEILKKIFLKFYSLSENLAVDKVILLFKGRDIFQQYIPKEHNVLALKFTDCVMRIYTHMIRKFILSLTGVGKFHVEILDSSS